MRLTASRLPGTLVATFLAPALALAGCGVEHSAPNAAVTTALPAVTTALSPKQRAEADAAAILAAVAVPPGARKLLPGKANPLKNTTEGLLSPNLVDRAGFWEVEGEPQQVLAWLSSHVGHSFTSRGGGTSNTAPGMGIVWSHDYSLPPVPAVEDTRQVNIEVADAGNGQTAIRVDALVTWLPVREPSEMVPAAATAIAMNLIPDANLNRKPPPPVTVTSPAAVRRIVEMVNSLPVFPPGPRECGASGGAGLVLTFLAAPHGRVLATAFINTEDCGEVLLALGSHNLASDARTWDEPWITEIGVFLRDRLFLRVNRWWVREWGSRWCYTRKV